LVFEAVSSDEIGSYQWFVDGELIESSSSVTLLFYETGNYAVELITESELGCYDSLSYLYKVHQVLDVDEVIDSNLKVHPNPVATGESIVIDSKFLIEEIKIYDTLGQLIWSIEDVNNSKIEISSDRFESGTYILSVYDALGQVYYRKIVRK